MTKEQIIQALRNVYADCMHRSASLDEPLRDDEYLEGVLDGRARGMLYAIQLLNCLEEQPKLEPKHFTKVPDAITLRQLYLCNDNWTPSSLLTLVVNASVFERLTAKEAVDRYGEGRVRSFIENHIYLFSDADKEDLNE